MVSGGRFTGRAPLTRALSPALYSLPASPASPTVRGALDLSATGLLSPSEVRRCVWQEGCTSLSQETC